jgi:hypothetical protein
VTLGLGIGSLIAEGGALLALFMIALFLLWAVVTLDHTGVFVRIVCSGSALHALSARTRPRADA